MSERKSRKIGNYVLGRTLGLGTFGKVKMGIHELSGEKVAIKILEKDRIVETADVERVQREIHILKLVRHPYIIQLYEIIETPKHIFLVMEMVDGGELFEYIVKNTKLPEIEACKFFQELISGIEYLHKIKVVHRDLKPENLLLDSHKNIKIVDFGLSNTYKSEELLKTACGSPCYAAPEVLYSYMQMIAGQKYIALKVDLWSCGVILFASLCGYLPFEDQNTSALYKKILAGTYTLPPDVSKDAQDMLANILNTDPNKRYGIQEIRNHNWYKLYKRNYDIPPGIVVGYNRIPIDYDILNQLGQYNISVDNAQKCLDANKHNDITTFYHLLLRRHLQNGGKSTADLNSELFDITLLEPKPRPQKMPIAAIVNNDMIRQQMREEVLKQRSFSTDKERGRQVQPRQIIHENDPSVNRIGFINAAHSVQARPSQLESPQVKKLKQQYPANLFPIRLSKFKHQTSIENSQHHQKQSSKSKREAIDTSIGYRSQNYRMYEQSQQESHNNHQRSIKKNTNNSSSNKPQSRRVPNQNSIYEIC